MKPQKFGIALLTIAMFVFVGPQSLLAQGIFGSISGVVTDSSGAVVTGATVKVTNVDTNVTTTWRTNGAGVYNVTSLNPGTYRVSAEAKGFKTAIANNIIVD